MAGRPAAASTTGAPTHPRERMPSRLTMSVDPERRGRDTARLYAEIAPRLFADLEDARLLPGEAGDAVRSLAQREWECFALYACVRGLVAGGGFNRETARA